MMEHYISRQLLIHSDILWTNSHIYFVSAFSKYILTLHFDITDLTKWESSFMQQFDRAMPNTPFILEQCVFASRQSNSISSLGLGYSRST